MRTLKAYILVACATFGLGLAISRSPLLIFRCEKPNQNVDSRDFNTEAVRVYVIPKSDPCDEPLEIARTRIVIRSTPFSVIKACVKADQMKPHPRLDAKTAQAFLD